MIKQAISLYDIVEQSEGNIVSDMDGEKVMLNIKKGKYYNLGTIGGQIWDQLKLSITVNQLVENLLSEYNVQQDECESQVISFLNLLLREELIIHKSTVQL